jgi:dTDP-4-dehydrorhamnose reductase
MRVLVAGASGMAGHVIALRLQGLGFDVDTLAGTRKVDEAAYLLDVTDQQELRGFLSSHHYDVVINCIGLLIGQCDARPDLAAYLNAYLPRFLEQAYLGTDTKVIHLSTDCVFSGANGPYRESSAFDGASLYDRSKALGEIDNGKDLTLRMSIIGPELKPDGSGLFHWFMGQSGEVSGYANVIWNGITTIELAKAIVAAIEQRLVGVYHLTPAESISKCDLLNLLNMMFARNVTMRPTLAVASNKTLLNTRKDFDYTVPDYGQMITEMRKWMEARPGLYAQYRIGRKRSASA